MYPEKLNSSLTFGWSAPVHGKLIEKSMSDCALPKYVTTLLENGVKEEEFTNISKHQNSRLSKFFQNIKRFLHIGRILTAEEKYLLHCKNFNEFMKNGKPNMALEEAGKAIHYIHELAIPNNLSDNFTRNDIIVKKGLDSYKHKYNFSSKTFKELFSEVLRVSKNRSEYSDNFLTSAEASNPSDNLNLAIDATSKFLQLIGLR